MGIASDVWLAIGPWVKTLAGVVLGFLFGRSLERLKARGQVRSQAMASVTEALDQVETLAGDLRVRLAWSHVDDFFVITKALPGPERARLEDEIGALRKLAGTLARFPEVSALVEKTAEAASRVLHSQTELETTGIERGEVTNDRHNLGLLFEQLLKGKDRALKSIA